MHRAQLALFFGTVGLFVIGLNCAEGTRPLTGGGSSGGGSSAGGSGLGGSGGSTGGSQGGGGSSTTTTTGEAANAPDLAMPRRCLPMTLATISRALNS